MTELSLDIRKPASQTAPRRLASEINRAAFRAWTPGRVALHMAQATAAGQRTTPAKRARRWRSYGWSQQRIADRLGCSRWRVRQLLA